MQVFQIWKTSWTTYLLVVWKSSGLLGSLLTKSSGLPGSRLDFQEVVWTSRKSLRTTYLLVVWKSSGSRLDFFKVVWTSCKVVWTSVKVVGSRRTSKVLRQSRLNFTEVVRTS
ncbi:hypothetical protein Bca4012_071404 [Brassica carinata]